jgi:hypothetical protein
MSFKFKSRITGFLLTAAVSLPLMARADTQTTHHAKKKPVPPPPLPSGTRGPVPQVPLDAIPAVAPQVTYDSGLLTIVAPNSTLGDILRGVRKHTSAEIEVPATANERVVTRLGPAPAREVMAELLNGSKFNYILLGSQSDPNALVRVVLVAKTPDTPPAQPGQENAAAPVPPPTPQPEAEAEENTDDNADQSAAEAEQPAPPPEQPGVKTPQQLLQEMQQRQLMMQQQQQQQGAQPNNIYPAPGLPMPQRPQPQDQQ